MKDPNSNHWWPPQKMPLEYWVYEDGTFSYCKSQGLCLDLSHDDVLKMADNAELLAKELREAAALMKEIYTKTGKVPKHGKHRKF